MLAALRKGTCPDLAETGHGLDERRAKAYSVLEVKWMRVLIYNDLTDKMETYQCSCDANMPYTRCHNLTVREFMAGSGSRTLAWSTRKFLKAYDQLIRNYGRKMRISRGFRRGWDAEEPMIMTHQLGTALDLGRDLSLPSLQSLATLSENMEVFDLISELDHNANGLHIHHHGNPVNDYVPYSQIRRGSKGPEVCVAQDVLWALGYDITKISGVFDDELVSQTQRFQTAEGLSADGVIGSNTWNSLMSQVRNVPGLEPQDIEDSIL